MITFQLKSIIVACLQTLSFESVLCTHGHDIIGCIWVSMPLSTAMECFLSFVVHFSPAAKASVGSEQVQEDLSSSPQAESNVGYFLLWI